jgi:ribosomal protein S18 acetylase RimI-like enzyme
MELRPATPADLTGIADIDATVESHRYLHIDRAGDGLNVHWKIEDRPLRERVIHTQPLGDDRQFLYRQMIAGIEEGLTLVAEHDGQIVAALAGRSDPDRGLFELIDLRVDFDFRRQGLGTAMMFQAIQTARKSQLRAIAAESPANNDPASQLLTKLGFQIGGLDSLRHSNHDLVKEAVTLLWYLVLD